MKNSSKARGSMLAALGAVSVMTPAAMLMAVEPGMNHGSMEAPSHCLHLSADCDEVAVQNAPPKGEMVSGSPSLFGDVLEPGQDMFGALSEINRLIEESEQNWDSVNMDVLWAHLRDMDALMTGAEVVKTTLPDGLRMHVSGAGAVKKAMDSMLPAHATFLRSVRPVWTISIEPVGADYELTVTSADPGEIQRIQALGFSGFMVQDDHHASHHLGLALGAVVH